MKKLAPLGGRLSCVLNTDQLLRHWQMRSAETAVIDPPRRCNSWGILWGRCGVVLQSRSKILNDWHESSKVERPHRQPQHDRDERGGDEESAEAETAHDSTAQQPEKQVLRRETHVGPTLSIQAAL